MKKWNIEILEKMEEEIDIVEKLKEWKKQSSNKWSMNHKFCREIEGKKIDIVEKMEEKLNFGENEEMWRIWCGLRPVSNMADVKQPDAIFLSIKPSRRLFS